LELSRSRLGKAIRALRRIVWHLGADRVGKMGRLDARFQSGYALAGGLRMSGTAHKT
jgi:biotin operon repressor